MALNIGEFSFLSAGDLSGYSTNKTSNEIDWLTSAQLALGDDEVIPLQIVKALIEDFYTNCSKSIENAEALIRCFHKLLDDAIQALRKISMKNSLEKDVIVSAESQLVNEQKAYSLLIKLFDSENFVRQLEKGRSILSDLLIDDREFRRISVLMEWCEENAFNEPKANAEVFEECAELENGSHIRAETLHMRRKNEKWCDMDLDGAMHGRLHALDEDKQNRVYNAVYTLIRCGRTKEAVALLKHAGLAALVPSLKYHEMSRDSSLTPLSNENPSFRIADSRAFFKRTVARLIAKGQSMSQIERCLWSVIGGLLEPALSLCSRTDDRLWCYLNTAIEGRLDAAIADHHKNATADVEQKGCDLMVASIFDEIATQECSPYYSSYRYLVMNDSKAHLSCLRQWLECHHREQHPHFLRYAAHIALIYMASHQPFVEEDVYWLLERYIRLLISLKMFTMIPFYASKLPPETAEHIIINFMYEIEDEKIRLNVLAAAHSVGIDTTELCNKLFAHAIEVNDAADEGDKCDLKLISAWNWLKYPGKEALIEALFAANLILRRFFGVEKLKEAKLLFEQMEGGLCDVVEKFWSIEFIGTSLPRELADAIAENRSYQAYLEALDDFNSWFNHFKMSEPEVPRTPSKDLWIRMDIQQRAAFEVEQAKAAELCTRHRSAGDVLCETAIDSLIGILLFPGGWLKFTFLEQNITNEKVRERMEKLREIRQSYLAAVVGMLIVIYDQSQDSHGAVRLADLLADEKYEIAEALSRDQLRGFCRHLAVISGGMNKWT
uniref:Nuclear pore complex protein n=1 Tax=Parascaris univalens TaxID=6257 RepID=A0A915A7E0_PARUN